MYYEFDEVMDMWVVLDWADRLVCYCQTEESAKQYIAEWVKTL